MSLTQFTVTLDQFELGIDLHALLGWVIFTPQVHGVAMGAGYSPRPASFAFEAVSGVIDGDGQLKDKYGGTVGVRLYANDPVLNLENLPYRAELRIPGEGRPVWFTTFDAPTTDITVNLVPFVPAPGTTAVGVTVTGAVDNVIQTGDTLQFYVDGVPIGAPVSLIPSGAGDLDGGDPSSPGSGSIDGGTL
jgi:hypothetical protein